MAKKRQEVGPAQSMDSTLTFEDVSCLSFLALGEPIPVDKPTKHPSRCMINPLNVYAGVSVHAHDLFSLLAAILVTLTFCLLPERSSAKMPPPPHPSALPVSHPACPTGCPRALLLIMCAAYVLAALPCRPSTLNRGRPLDSPEGAAAAAITPPAASSNMTSSWPVVLVLVGAPGSGKVSEQGKQEGIQMDGDGVGSRGKDTYSLEVEVEGGEGAALGEEEEEGEGEGIHLEASPSFPDRRPLPPSSQSTFADSLVAACPGRWSRVCQDTASKSGKRGTRNQVQPPVHLPCPLPPSSHLPANHSPIMNLFGHLPALQCLRATELHLAEGRSVVIDRTNVNPEQRMDFIKAAKKSGCAAHSLFLKVHPCLPKNPFSHPAHPEASLGAAEPYLDRWPESALLSSPHHHSACTLFPGLPKPSHPTAFSATGSYSSALAIADSPCPPPSRPSLPMTQHSCMCPWLHG